jgi:hypothetical protein
LHFILIRYDLTYNGWTYICDDVIFTSTTHDSLSNISYLDNVCLNLYNCNTSIYINLNSIRIWQHHFYLQLNLIWRCTNKPDRHDITEILLKVEKYFNYAETFKLMFLSWTSEQVWLHINRKFSKSESVGWWWQIYPSIRSKIPINVHAAVCIVLVTLF